VTGSSIVLWRLVVGFDSLNPQQGNVAYSARRDSNGGETATRYILTVDFEEDNDIDSFIRFVQYHSKRLKCPSKDVFIRLAHEWEKQLVNQLEPNNGNGIKKEKKKTLKEPSE
jgi:hypothetical protein